MLMQVDFGVFANNINPMMWCVGGGGLVKKLKETSKYSMCMTEYLFSGGKKYRYIIIDQELLIALRFFNVNYDMRTKLSIQYIIGQDFIQLG